MTQWDLFPEDVTLEPTISMAREETFVTMCSRCGVLVCARTEVKLGACPQCDGHQWWLQKIPVGPFKEALDASFEDEKVEVKEDVHSRSEGSQEEPVA